MDKFLVPFLEMSEGVGSGDIKDSEFHATLELTGKDKKITLLYLLVWITLSLLLVTLMVI